MKTLIAILLFAFAPDEVIQFTSKGVTLEGTLQLPGGDTKVPVVVFVHGSGRATRNDYEGLTKLLLAQGYAVFRYDKRGVGKSGGEFVEVSTANSKQQIPTLAMDAAAAIQRLKTHSRIDAKKIIVAGGSQAGWIIPPVTGLTEVAATVIFCGPLVSVGEEIYYSRLAENGSHTQAEADEMLKQFKGPHGFSNLVYIGNMYKPSFWIFGGKDVSIPVKKSIARLDSIRLKLDLPIQTRIYPEMNHGMVNEVTKKSENWDLAIVDWLIKAVRVP